MLRLERIHYGAKPEDWRLQWGFELSSEDIAGEFWKMFETPEQQMPGAWLDTESDLGSDTDLNAHSDAESDKDQGS